MPQNTQTLLGVRDTFAYPLDIEEDNVKIPLLEARQVFNVVPLLNRVAVLTEQVQIDERLIVNYEQPSSLSYFVKRCIGPFGLILLPKHGASLVNIAAIINTKEA